ncbi:MAG: response regulator [Hyphomicrobiales bacterium]|nr:response regulator [Hyphomicrobiales bacterium]
MVLSAVETDPFEQNALRRVLIVDDDPDFAEGLEITLLAKNHVVGHALNRASAIEEAKRFAPDVALIDLRLADSDGLELISELREVHPELLCVMMTGYASTDSAIKALHEGAFDYMTKPLRTSDLMTTLDRCFKHIDLVRENEEAYSALREAQQAFQNMVDYAPLAFNLKDLQGRYQVVNRHFADWFGLSASQMIGKTVYDLQPPEIADEFIALDRRVTQTRELFEHECDVPFADGTIHRIAVTKYPVLDRDGQLVSIGSINTDITHTRQVERQLQQSQKMEAIGQLTGGIAHDLNNILAVIQGGVELLAKDKNVDPPLIRTVLRATSRGSDLIHRLLAFSRRQPLNPQSVDLTELVGEMADIVTRTLGETIELDIAPAPGLWAVKADVRQVENAILNLAVNAQDAMPDGGRLTIRCTNVRLDQADTKLDPDVTLGDYVVLKVTDTGIGMSPDVRSQAFEPFFTTKDFEQGTGLGLSMVYGFAQQSGGFANIVSEENKGTTVQLYLPRTQEQRTDKEKPACGPAPQGNGELILVIEDDADVRRMTVKQLEVLGYRSIDVADAAAAREVLSAGDPLDLVLSDVVLPGGTSGPEFVDETLRSRPDLRFLFMSGYSIEAIVSSGTLNPAINLLSKPFRRQDLAKAVKRALTEQPGGFD